MVVTLVLLFFFTIIYEAIIVAATLAIAERKKLRSSILSAIIEPIKLVSLLFVISSQYKILSIIVMAVACGVGNYLTIWFLDRKRHAKMFILRGLPGSGKSTKVAEIVKNTVGSVEVCSADTYFIRPDGIYDWVGASVGRAHRWCYDRARGSMMRGCPFIIIDNTNIRRSEFAPYLDLAEEFKYEVEEIVVGKFDEESCKIYAERNVHKCPLETILKRAKLFEP